MGEETRQDFYTLQQVAQRLQLSEKTVHRLLDSGAIEGIFYARRWRFTEEAITRYVKMHTRTSGKGARKKRAYIRRGGIGERLKMETEG